MVTGSYPATPEGWSVDLTRPSSAVTVFAVCADGIERAEAVAFPLDLSPGTPRCTGGGGAAPPTCQWPRAGTGAATCDGVLVGGGYRVADGKLPDYSVHTAAVSSGLWQVGVDGRDAANGPLALRLTAICAAFPAPTPAVAPSAPAAQRITPVASQNPTLPIAIGLSLLLLLGLILVIRSRSRRPVRSGPVAVVLRAHRGTFRLEELREVQ